MSDATLYERDLYVEITIAWYQTQPRGRHIDRALRPYVLGTGFADSVRDSQAHVDLQRVAAICALVVSSETWQLDRLRKVLDTQGVGLVPKDIFDPVSAWWYPLERPSVLGVHYWELGNGTLELRRLSKFDRPPALQFGRFAGERTEREDSTISRRGKRGR